MFFRGPSSRISSLVFISKVLIIKKNVCASFRVIQNNSCRDCRISVFKYKIFYTDFSSCVFRLHVAVCKRGVIFEKKKKNKKFFRVLFQNVTARICGYSVPKRRLIRQTPSDRPTFFLTNFDV